MHVHTHVAAASVLAGVAVTLVGFQLTVGPAKTRLARARIAALTRVSARGAVGTRLVVGTVVEVLVTEEPPPALLTITLPWLAARSMEAAWVANTLGAGGALPAHTTRTALRGLTVAVLLTAVCRADGWKRKREGVITMDAPSHTHTHTLVSTQTHPRLHCWLTIKLSSW